MLLIGSILLALVVCCTTLSITESPRARMARSRLSEAFKSPSKKLTIYPELVLPEPSDPTALLLRASEVTKLSERLRTKAKANALFVEGTVDALIPMAIEQENARGNFPGPVPIVFSLVDDESLTSTLEQLEEVEGVDGILLKCFGGTEIDCVEKFIEEAKNDASLAEKCRVVLKMGLQPIPDIVLTSGTDWSEDDVVRLVDAVEENCGGFNPVSIVFTNGESDAAKKEEDEPSTPNLTIPSSLSKRISFIGSVRTSAGGGRMNTAMSSLSSCKFNGALLRAHCVPGYRMNPDLNVVGDFWSAVISELKSLKSKSFSFRSTTKLSLDVPKEWFNYQKDVMESGALGGPGGAGAGGSLDPDSGDYTGF